VTHLVDEGKAVGVCFSKAFDTVSYSILLEKWLLMAWVGVHFAG